MKRIVAVLALSALAFAPAHGSPAHQKDWSAPYASAYTYNGDGLGQWSADPSTGKLTALRVNPVPGSFGCGGNAGFSYLRTGDFTLTGDATHIGFDFTNTVIDTYAWLKVSMLDSTGYISTGNFRGVVEVLPGSGSADFELLSHEKAAALAGTTVHLEVGIETSSACPNVDGGTATIASIWVA